MAAGSAAEQPYIADQYLPYVNNVFLPPEDGGGSSLVMVVSELPQDELLRYRAERFIRRIGQKAIYHELESDYELESHPDSLLDGIQRAVEGDPVALRMVEANVKSDVLERTIKAGLIIKVDLDADSSGNISQHGQSLASIQENTLLFAANIWQMRARAEAETRNSLRITSLYSQGLLEDYSFVVFSRTADDMTKQELVDAGFFVDTMPCAIQVTSASQAGLTTESAFVAGISGPGEDQHDAQTMIKVGAELGIDFGGMSATQIIDTPVLIHKSLIPNGVIDLVKLYDNCAGGTFFGEAKPQQDYLLYREECIERAATYVPKVQQIMGELLAYIDYLSEPIDAVKLLSKLSQKRMVEQATYDTNINPQVFGKTAAYHIEQARIHRELGNNELAVAATSKAQATAKSSSCPSGISTSELLNAQELDNIKIPESKSWHGGKKYYNTKCNSCKKIKLEVGACHICQDCVRNPRLMQKAFDEAKRKKSPKIRPLKIVQEAEFNREENIQYEPKK